MSHKITLISFTILALVAFCMGSRVKFCSGPDLTGTCATKSVEVRTIRQDKCEDFPFRFRWFYTARSVQVQEHRIIGGCPGTCRLHTTDTCRCLTGTCPMQDVTCGIYNLPENHDFHGITCT